MIPVLRKIAQLNIKYRKKWGPHNIDACTGVPPDKVTTLGETLVWLSCATVRATNR